MAKYRVRVCRGPTCGDERNSRAIAAEFERLLREAGNTNVEKAWQSCYGRCSKGPNVLVRRIAANAPQRSFAVAMPPPARSEPATMYNYVTTADVVDIVREHVIGGRPARGPLARARQREVEEELARERADVERTTRDGETE